MPPKDIALGNPYQLLVDGERFDPSQTSVIGMASSFRTIENKSIGRPDDYFRPHPITLSFEVDNVPKSWFTSIELHHKGIERHGNFTWRKKHAGKWLRRFRYKTFTKILKSYEHNGYIHLSATSSSHRRHHSDGARKLAHKG